MILSNLSVVLAERKLKITDISNATGISRQTLTNLAYNHGDGIRYETLDTLCSFLKIAPGELLLHYPITLTILEAKETTKANGDGKYSGATTLVVLLTIRGIHYKEAIHTQGTVFLNEKQKTVPRFYVELEFPSILKTAYEEMPTIFQSEITGRIVDKMYKLFSVPDDAILELNIVDQLQHDDPFRG